MGHRCSGDSESGMAPIERFDAEAERTGSKSACDIVAVGDGQVCGARRTRSVRGALVGSALASIDLLYRLKRLYRRARRIVLVVDNVIVHKSSITRQWLANNPKFELLLQHSHPWQLHRTPVLRFGEGTTHTNSKRRGSVRAAKDRSRQRLSKCRPYCRHSPWQNQAISNATICLHAPARVEQSFGHLREIQPNRPRRLREIRLALDSSPGAGCSSAPGHCRHSNKFSSARRCTACFSGSACFSFARLINFQRTAGRPPASGKPIRPKSGAASWRESRKSAT